MTVTMKIGKSLLTIYQAYAPDSSYSEPEINSFYDELQDQLNLSRRNNDTMVMGDFNAKHASKNWPGVAGKFIPGQRNVNGERFLQFCAINQLTIMNPVYQHKPHCLVTWISPDGRTQNQIDIIAVTEN